MIKVCDFGSAFEFYASSHERRESSSHSFREQRESKHSFLSENNTQHEQEIVYSNSSLNPRTKGEISSPQISSHLQGAYAKIVQAGTPEYMPPEALAKQNNGMVRMVGLGGKNNSISGNSSVSRSSRLFSGRASAGFYKSDAKSNSFPSQHNSPNSFPSEEEIPPSNSFPSDSNFPTNPSISAQQDFGPIHALDMWALGAIFLEICHGIPLWMSYKCRVEEGNGKGDNLHTRLGGNLSNLNVLGGGSGRPRSSYSRSGSENFIISIFVMVILLIF